MQDEIQKNLYEANRWWNDWKFQLHWNKIEWVDPKFNPKIIKSFSVSSKTYYISQFSFHFFIHLFSFIKIVDI